MQPLYAEVSVSGSATDQGWNRNRFNHVIITTGFTNRASITLHGKGRYGDDRERGLPDQVIAKLMGHQGTDMILRSPLTRPGITPRKVRHL